MAQSTEPRLPAGAGIAALIFALFAAHGALLGLSDDEAYYWVLSQRPALGYAYHPPFVAWLIAAAEGLLRPLFGSAHPFVVRLPAALCAGGLAFIGSRWLLSLGVHRHYAWAAGAMLLTLPGFGAAGWMMVPDLPLLLGWALAFWGAWRVSAQNLPGAALLFAGVLIATLSKHSGVLVALSAAVCVWPARKRRVPALAAIFLGGLVAAAPTVAWNLEHEWVSLLYQLKDRHSGGFSILRWLRFWGSQLGLGGPALVLYLIWFGRRLWIDRRNEVARFTAIWVAPPALVYFFQPLIADFKPHWPMVVWIPLAWELGYRAASGLASTGERSLARLHLAWGFPLVALMLLACHAPVFTAAASILARGKDAPDPKWDVTNDLYGWRQALEPLAKSEVPVIGSRYQTASQAAAAIARAGGDPNRATLSPKTIRDWDEWPRFFGLDGDLPADTPQTWPRLERSVFYVSDNRYSGEPRFKNARCAVAQRNEILRWGLKAKEILIWACEPITPAKSL
ncbi:MAG: glycosyltransferase family 39 protein [Bdellovibrionales bacterium]|nr:glycosyltransferase family 39 protein [Bdellovibrionales bacterium]